MIASSRMAELDDFESEMSNEAQEIINFCFSFLLSKSNDIKFRFLMEELSRGANVRSSNTVQHIYLSTLHGSGKIEVRFSDTRIAKTRSWSAVVPFRLPFITLTDILESCHLDE